MKKFCIAATTLAMFNVLVGCQAFNLLALDWSTPEMDPLAWMGQKQVAEAPTAEDFETSVKTPLLGEYTVLSGFHTITLQGIGLVTGLKGTGEEPPVSPYRTAMLREMKRRSIPNPQQILNDPNTAIVVVTVQLPPLVKAGDNFDVMVRLPPESEATSLNGGWLMDTFLVEKGFVTGGMVKDGHAYATARGPILTSFGDESYADSAAGLRRGRVLGGGSAIKERDMSILLRSDYKSVRMADRVAKAIGARFSQHNEHGIREPLAVGKTDQKIKLDIHYAYRENIPRYKEVIRSIALREDRVARHVRMQKLKKQLLNPNTSERASIRLEAIGHEAIPVLIEGLHSDDFEVQFYSAVSLTYLENSEGLKVLAKAAREEPAFRVFAFAAMATAKSAEPNLLLRDIISAADVTSTEARYGAFRALSSLDENDWFIQGEKIEDQFMLHTVQSDGPPMIHLTTRRKSEIVLFGENQQVETPMVARAGSRIMINAQPGSDQVVVSLFSVGESDESRTVSTSVEEIIRAIAELGGSYPDIAQFLTEADRQGNLAGRLEIDVLPQPGRIYYRPGHGEGTGSSRSQKKVGSSRFIPNLFESKSESNDDDEDDMEGDEEEEKAPVSDEKDEKFSLKKYIRKEMSKYQGTEEPER